MNTAETPEYQAHIWAKSDKSAGQRDALERLVLAAESTLREAKATLAEWDLEHGE